MDVFNIALSGLHAAQTQISASATNIANANTPGYQASRVDLVELSTGGVGVAGIHKDPTPGPAQADGSEQSNVDLPSEMVNLTRSQLLYSANAALLRIGQKTTGSLLDILDTRKRDRD